MNTELDALAGTFWDHLMRADPLWASLVGDHRFDDEVPDVSEEAEDALIADLDAVAARAEAIVPGDLDEDERVTRGMLAFEAAARAAHLRSRLAELWVDPKEGPQADLLVLAQSITLPEPAHARALVARYRRMNDYLDAAADRLRAGVRNERTPPQIAVTQTIAQLDGMLGVASGDSLFVTAPPPPRAWDGSKEAAWREALTAGVEEVVHPALCRYRDCLEDEILPHARSPERSGLSWLRDGEEAYRAAIVHHTTLDLDAHRVHETGLEEVAALGDEYRKLAPGVLGTSELGEIFRRLRDDPDLRFATSDEVRSQAGRALTRAQAAVPGWFGRLPRAPCVVEEMSAHEVEHGTIAYYMPPAADGSRPGTYVVNTHAPGTRTRFEAEALAFHEAVPGHHLQIALAQELDDLPDFRRHSLVTAYVEGWGLYAERLADEVGLYSGDLDRLGMLSFDSWRACRLVIDTGLHALGWSRMEAITYLRENSPQAPNNIANEVDRYLARPGQALAYKLGQREIVRARAEATRRLGSGFDLRGFHDALLGRGPVPLGMLAELVDRWAPNGG